MVFLNKTKLIKNDIKEFIIVNSKYLLSKILT
jgi:hypothetical protein